MPKLAESLCLMFNLRLFGTNRISFAISTNARLVNVNVLADDGSANLKMFWARIKSTFLRRPISS